MAFAVPVYHSASHVPVQVPGDADPDMGIQSQRLILCKHADRIYSGIDTIAEWEVNDAVFSAKRYCRFCNLCCQNAQP